MLRRYAERNSEPTAISYVLIYRGGARYYDLMHMDDGLESSISTMILSFLGVLLPLILNLVSLRAEKSEDDFRTLSDLGYSSKNESLFFRSYTKIQEVITITLQFFFL